VISMLFRNAESGAEFACDVELLGEGWGVEWVLLGWVIFELDVLVWLSHGVVAWGLVRIVLSGGFVLGGRWWLMSLCRQWSLWGCGSWSVGVHVGGSGKIEICRCRSWGIGL